MRKFTTFLTCAALVGIAAQPVYAKVSAADTAKLGKDLTPVGAERRQQGGHDPCLDPVQGATQSYQG
ncbi:MAG: hypothetical protein ACRESS_05260 [Stenotrophobium sp.]